jgi:hypothetical protein
MGDGMRKFVPSLFGCAHNRCTFPITATKSASSPSAYIVCLDCGKEFPYDWERMKVVRSVKRMHAVM